MQKVRTRFAPSPTGFVHVGGLRTALFNFLFARKFNGSFILRIEDTDPERYLPGSLDNLLNILKWAGLSWDEGPEVDGPHKPYIQSERLEIYQKYAKELVAMGKAYYAFDTAEEEKLILSQLRTPENSNPKYDYITRSKMRNGLTLNLKETEKLIENGTPYVIRLLVPEKTKIQFTDLIRGDISFQTSELNDQVLLKTDGYPTYHLANVIDDHLMEITHIIRGEEWLSSVPKHLLLYQSFGWTPPLMAHVPLIFNPDRTKMKKRDIKSLEKTNVNQVDPDVESYKNKGYEKEALINYLALLGWNPGEGDERQIFSLEELIQEFSLERVNKSAAIFDLKKLNWLNNEHIKRLPNQHFIDVLKNDLSALKIPIPNDEYLIKVIDLIKSRVHFVNEFLPTCSYFFVDPQHYDEQVLNKNWKDNSAKLLAEFCTEISTIKEYTATELEIVLQKIAEKNNTSSGSIIHPVRLAVSGVGTGPSLFELLHVLGPEVVVRRIRRAIELFPKLIL